MIFPGADACKGGPMHRSRIALIAALISCLVVLGISWPSMDAAAAAMTCHGEPATHVGTQGAQLEGTEGPDVIVTNGAWFFDAKGGDDLICFTRGAAEETDDMQVNAGEGNDVVDATLADVRFVDATLGPGDDVFTGGPEQDAVLGNRTYDTPGQATADGTDTISTGAGNDGISTGGAPGFPDHDDVDLGPGRDNASISGPTDPNLPIRGGTGKDEVSLDHGALAHELMVDNAVGLATHDGQPEMAWSGMEAFHFGSIGPRKPPSFVGGPGRERIRSTIALKSLDFGGGNDMVNFLLRRKELVHRLAYEGGPGDDFLMFAFQVDRIGLDLGARRLRYRDGDRTVRGRVHGFERLRLQADRLDLRGTGRAETFDQLGCRGVVDGGGGADTIRVVATPDFGCGEDGGRQTVRGGGGDDTLVGGREPDTLIGGAGNDQAYGGEGIDRCVAEKEVGCEQ